MRKVPPELGELVLRRTDLPGSREALSVRVSHRFTAGSARFDEDNLVSDAGLVPLLGLAEQTGLPEIIAEKVSITTPRIKSGAANPAPKLLAVIAGMCAGADSIDDLDVLRAGGMPILFDGVYAPSTLGTLLREFSFGHARQLESVLREHLAALAERTELLVGIDEQVFIDIDSLLRPVYGHAKQGASYGHTKIAGKQVLRKGLSPLATTISTQHSAPVIAGMRLRAGKTGSGKGAGRMVAQAIATARAAGATGKILVRGDSAYGNRAVVRACRRGNAEFSLVMTKNRATQRAIAAIPDTAWTPVRYPGAVQDPETGAWISDAEVAEVPLHRLRPHHRPDHRPTGGPPRQRRPLPRRAVPGLALPPVLHQLDPAHRAGRHRPPPPRDHRNRVRRPDRRTPGPPALRALRRQLRRALCAAIAHNLLHAAGTLAADPHARARGDTATTDRHRPDSLARPGRKPVLHLPAGWPWARAWLQLWDQALGHTPSRLTPPRPTSARAETISGRAGQTSGITAPQRQPKIEQA